MEEDIVDGADAEDDDHVLAERIGGPDLVKVWLRAVSTCPVRVVDA